MPFDSDYKYIDHEYLYTDKDTGVLLNKENIKNFPFVNKKLTFYLADYDKIKGRIIVRNRKYGDKIQLCGRDFSSSVKKLINETVPPEKRSTLHFIEDSEGTVFAERIGIAQRVAPDQNTVRLLRISVKNYRME